MSAADAVADLVRDLATVQHHRAALGQREIQLKAALRALAGLGSTTVGDLTLSITMSRRFDLDTAAARWPAIDHPDFYVVSLDPKRLKALIPPAEYEVLMVETGEPRVTLR